MLKRLFRKKHPQTRAEIISNKITRYALKHIYKEQDTAVRLLIIATVIGNLNAMLDMILNAMNLDAGERERTLDRAQAAALVACDNFKELCKEKGDKNV